MQQLVKRLSRTGVDGIVIGILSIIAIGVAVFDLIGGSSISQPLLVGILGLFLLEIALQRTRLEAAKEEIINQLKGVRVEVFGTDKEFADAKYRLLLETEGLVYDTELCQPVYTQGEESRYRKLLHERVTRGEITYKVVWVIYHRNMFEAALRNIFRFHKFNYYIGYYTAPPEVIPVMNVMIFDRKNFLLGGYYGPSARGNDRNIFIKHEQISHTLEQYYDYLWGRARLFNEHKAINWQEIKHCGLSLGYSEEELNDVVRKIAEEVGFTQVETIN